MSFSVFLQCYRNGEPAAFSRSTLDEVFGASIVRREPDGSFKLYFADGGGADVCSGDYPGDDDNFVQHVGFDRPGGDAFWEALYRLADVTKSVILWPDDDRPSTAVTDEATVGHLGSGFTGPVLGQPKLVHSGRELRDYIFRKRERRQL